MTDEIKDIDLILIDPEYYANKISIEKLVEVLKKMSDKYFNTGEPYVDDETYDVMVSVLKERDPNNSFLFQVGTIVSTKDTVKLPFYMPSLDKIKLEDKTFEKDIKKWLSKNKGPWIIADKLDGMSVMIHKDDNGKIDLYSRGDSVTGRKITKIFNHAIDKNAVDKMPNGASVRGEILFSKEQFKKIDDDYENSRNAVAGLSNRKNVDPKLTRLLDIVVYNVLNPNEKYTTQLKKLKKWCFNIVWHTCIGEEYSDSKLMKEFLIKTLNHRREDSPYDIDGLVITSCNNIEDPTDKNPSNMIAFKMNTETKNTKVEKIIWKPSMYGYYKPVIKIKPVRLSGSTVNRATAHNAKYIVDNVIGKGAIVKIVRSGEVIPKIIEVIRKAKNIDFPKDSYEWNDSGVDLIAINESSKIKKIINLKKNVKFFKSIGVKYLDMGIMETLYDAGYKTILSLLEASSENEHIEAYGIGEKRLNEIYNQIDTNINRASLVDLMMGSLLFGRGIGSEKLKDVITKYPDIIGIYENNSKNIYEIIMEIKGFSDKSAKKIVTGLPKFITFLEKIKKYYPMDHLYQDSDQNNSDNQNDGIMSGFYVTMTGTRDSSVIRFIEDNGGKVLTNFTKETNMVIYKGKETTKLKKAKDKNIKMFELEEFKKLNNID
jgi:DNA ligase (NAD+)